jgi:DNA-binding NarL/FixJ family response regulator
MFCGSKYDMVILMAGLDFDTPLELARTMKAHNPDVPILLLAMNNSSLAELDPDRPECKAVIDRIFVWNGYSKLFVAMIKYMEDLHNVDNDTQIGMVPVILLVEDSIRYYSRYLPVLYSVVLNQTKLLVEEERSVETNKIIRLRWRPKILLAANYEEALDLFQRYEPFLLTVISDIRYPVNGIEDPEAGFKFLSDVKARRPDTPVFLQSSENSNRNKAYAMGAAFADKNSNTLVHELIAYFQTHLGFGPFVFRKPDGGELSRAATMDEFETRLKTIPDDSLFYHGRRNNFSTWLMARGEARIARILRSYSADDFDTADAMRNYLIGSIDKIKTARMRGSIPILDPKNPDSGKTDLSAFLPNKLLRLGGGSVGGKGRGLAFIGSLIENFAFTNLSKKMEIQIPYTAFIGIDEFEKYMEQNDLWDFLWFNMSEADIKKMFLSLPLDYDLVDRLRMFLGTTDRPLAVRSSGLFEDMLIVPFSGVYDTYIIPNSNPDLERRLAELCDAVRLIYASLYSESARQYFEAVSYKIEEERMAVIIQEFAGTRHGKWYYPIISGIAQSYNYYPFSSLKPDDGLCVAGIGHSCHVVNGGASYRFSPKYPKIDATVSGSRIDGTQRTFYALDMENPGLNLLEGADATLKCLDISEAESNEDFAITASTLNREDDRLEPGTGGAGPRIINFAPLLKYDLFPFAEVLDAVLKISSKSMGLPVEIEFAVSKHNETRIVYLLQIKPLVQNTGKQEININMQDIDKYFVISGKSMGNGRDTTISDIVWVDPETFSPRHTVVIAKEIEELNNMLKTQGLHYVLVGPGRWGTRDFSLGIPVIFPQISSARVIIETNLSNFSVESSQGSHFFHNVTSMNIGYLSVSPGRNKDHIDWEWLKSLHCEKKTQFCRWSKTTEPLDIMMDGRIANTVIYKR